MKNEPSWCSVGEYLGRRLEQAGIRHYFTVPGDFNLVLLDQLLKNPRLQLIGCCRFWPRFRWPPGHFRMETDR